jgi:hypothetical protein
MAIGQRQPHSVIHHSDQGSQYTSLAFGKRCQEAGVRPSTGTVGDAYDNAMCESFLATLEWELLDRRRFVSQAEARIACFSFIEGWYNPVRLHSARATDRLWPMKQRCRRKTRYRNQHKPPRLHQTGSTPVPAHRPEDHLTAKCRHLNADIGPLRRCAHPHARLAPRFATAPLHLTPASRVDRLPRTSRRDVVACRSKRPRDDAAPPSLGAGSLGSLRRPIRASRPRLDPGRLRLSSHIRTPQVPRAAADRPQVLDGHAPGMSYFAHRWGSARVSWNRGADAQLTSIRSIVARSSMSRTRSVRKSSRNNVPKSRHANVPGIRSRIAGGTEP